MPRLLRNWLTAYAEHTAISEAPKEFHFWTGVSVIAGALRRRVWIDQKKFQWTPNFYIILVAPPGVATKSTTMKIGYSLLQEIKGIKFGPQSVTWQGLLQSFADAQVSVADPKITASVYDLTATRYPMACISCAVSELGVFLKPKDEEFTAFLTDMWDGQKGPWERKLATRDAPKIENPWLNFIGCTTPSWLRDGFNSSMIHGGLTSRCIFIWANSKAQLIPYPADLIDDKEYAQQRADLIHDLGDIASMFGPMTLSPEAKKFGIELYTRYADNRPGYLSSERFSGYWARKQTHIHKLAMIVSAAGSDSMEIDRQSLELSDMMITAVEKSLVTVFDHIVDSESGKHVDEIMTIVRRNKTITRETLWRHCIRTMDSNQFAMAIEGAVKAGYLTYRNGKYMPKKVTES